MSTDSLQQGLDLDKANSVASTQPVSRPSSGMFSGAGDSGVWPGQQTVGPVSFISAATLGCIVIWYVTGALTNSTSKQTLQQFKGAKPFLSLTLMQHAMAVIGGNIAIRIFKIRCGLPGSGGRLGGSSRWGARGGGSLEVWLVQSCARVDSSASRLLRMRSGGAGPCWRRCPPAASPRRVPSLRHL